MRVQKTNKRDMERWVGKTAVVTGASSGIGAAIATDLACAGLNVVAIGRNEQRLRAVCSSIPVDCRGSIKPFACDVTNEDAIKEAFAWIEQEFNGVDILVNNAGILRQNLLLAADNSQDMRDQVNTNIMAVVYCTREAFQLMKKHGVDGHIVNINSTAGHSLPYMVGILDLNIYSATKYAVTAMTETVRQELIQHNTKIKITVSDA